MSYQRYLATAALVLVLSAMTSEVSAQGPLLGAKVGATWSIFKNDPDDGIERSQLNSFAGGGFLRFDLGRIGLQPELMVITKGSHEKPFTNAQVKARLEYLEVPVLLYVPLLQSRVGPYLIGGPAVAFEIGCRSEGFFIDEEFSQECVDVSGDAFTERKKVDFGAIAGAGLSLPMGPGAALIEGRYTFGLSNLIEKPDGPMTKNRSLGVMAGYAIPLGR